MNITLPCLVFEDEKSAREASCGLLTKIGRQLADGSLVGAIFCDATSLTGLRLTEDHLKALYLSFPDETSGLKITYTMREMNYSSGNKSKLRYSGLVSIENVGSDELKKEDWIEIRLYEDEKTLSDDIHKAYREFVGRYDIKDGIARLKELK